MTLKLSIGLRNQLMRNDGQSFADIFYGGFIDVYKGTRPADADAIEAAEANFLFRVAKDGAATTSGTLEVGQTYKITTFVAGDDFANVGAASNATDVTFTVPERINAGGATPGWTVVGVTDEYTYDGELFGEPEHVLIDGVKAAKGTVTSLAAGEWGWNADTLYVNLDGTDPETEDADAIIICYSLHYLATPTAWTNESTLKEIGLEFQNSADAGKISKPPGDTWNGVAVESGVASYFRFYAANTDIGTGADKVRFEGMVSVFGGQMNMVGTNISDGANQVIDSFNITMPA